MTLREIETPAVLLDLDAMERNTERLRRIVQGSSMRLFPHYKSHKCVDIARWQLENGAEGITCAKLSEAEDLAKAGIPRIVLANQVVQPSKLRRLAALAGEAEIAVCADSAEPVLTLAEACRQAGTQVGVLIELEVGMRRCGLDSFEAVRDLARLILTQPALRFEGIQAYAGQLSHETDAAKRRAGMQAAEARAAALKAYLERDCGIPVKEICGGSTGTAADKPKSTVYTQLQAGSYLFMDTSYGKLDLGFEQAMFVLATVISRSADRAVLDCGVKSLPMDQDPPCLRDDPGRPLILHEEHTIVEGADLAPGQPVLLVPGHCCTTNNSFDRVCLTRNGIVQRVIPVTSRAKAQ